MWKVAPIDPNQLLVLLDWYENPKLAEYFRRYPPAMDWGRADLIAQYLKGAYFIYEDGKAVGLVQLGHDDPIARTVEIAMVIDPSTCSDRFRASRVAYTEICNYIFDYMNYEKAYMKVLTTRTKLRDRLQADGWSVEGTLRQSCPFQGERCDEWVMGLLKNDYYKIRGSTLRLAGGF